DFLRGRPAAASGYHSRLDCRIIPASSAAAGASVRWWWSECEGFPEGMPVAVEVGGTQSGHGCGAMWAPVHAGAFETHSDQLFAGRFDHPRTDWPVLVPIVGVVHPVQAGLDIGDEGIQGAALTSS